MSSAVLREPALPRVRAPGLGSSARSWFPRGKGGRASASTRSSRSRSWTARCCGGRSGERSTSERSGSTRTWRPNAGDDVVEEHTERSLGHEEVYVVLAGRATFTLDDETVDAPAGTVVFIRDRRREAARPCRGARDFGARDRRAARRGVRAVALGGLLRGRAPSHGRRLRRVRRGARGRSPNGAPITLRRCTTSRAPRRSRGVPTMRVAHSRERWSSTRASPSTRRRTRTSSGCASARTGRSSSA